MVKNNLETLSEIFISELEDTLKSIPQKKHASNLLVKKEGHGFKFYEKFPKSRKLKYLSKKTQMQRIKDLAQEDYFEEVEKETRELLKFMKLFVQGLKSKSDPLEVYENLPEPRKEHVCRLSTTDVEKWKDKYRALPYYLPLKLWKKVKEDNKIEACNGTMVKSKSESLIIKVFEELGIPYVYEYPLKANGEWYFPDFRVLNTRTGEEYVYEHFGGLDDTDYINKNLFKKLKDYLTVGIGKEKKLVYTFENHDHPLCERDVKEFAKLHFL